MNTININSVLNQHTQTQFTPVNLEKNFFNLLIAQIKNQDPTDPIKNTELTSQLAQINTASGIERLNNIVQGFSSKINKSQTIQISSLIGHRVMIPSNNLIHTKNSETTFGIELISNASLIEIKIKDKEGNIVHEIKKIEDKIAPGIYNFSWSGKNAHGKEMETGKYTISVVAKNKDKEVPVESLEESVVNSIIMSSEDPIIDLGASGNTTLSKIRKILQ